MAFARPLPSRRSVLLLDAALAAWTVAWLVLAFFVARGVRDLAQLSATMGLAGQAIEEVGHVVRALGQVPLVQVGLDVLARRIEEAGASAQRSAAASRESVETLAILLGVAVGLLPALPVLGLYVPLRLGHVRERRAVRAALAAGDAEELLALRALASLPLDRARALSPHPLRDVAEGRTRALADAELARLGVRREPV